MVSHRLLPATLQARMAWCVVLGLLAGLWALALYADRSLREDLERQLEAQQLAQAALLAQGLEQALQVRAAALQHVARELGATAQGEPQLLQQRLEALTVLQQLFNGGVFATDARGVALAAHPMQSERVGRDYADRAYVQAALAGRMFLSPPLVGRTARVPVVVMAAPLPAADGRAAGVLAAVVDLASPDFLDALPGGSLGGHMRWYVAERASRTIVAASDRSRLLSTLAAPGGDAAALEPYWGGAQGALHLPRQGVQMLAAVRQVPSFGWMVAVEQPLAQALAPLDALRQRIVLATLALTVLVTAGVWCLLRRALRPLEGMAAQMAAMARHEAPLQALPERGGHEVRQLVQGFNHLLVQLDRRQQGLRESEKRYRAAFLTSPDAVDITRVSDNQHLEVNDGFVQMFGWAREEVVGKSGLELGIWRDKAARDQMLAQLLAHGVCRSQEQQLYHRDGHRLTVLMSASLFDFEGEPCMLWVTHDITEHRQAREQIERLTFTDQLTGLPNRSQFMERLEQAQARCLAERRLGALLYLDLDDFRTINDALGHGQGDALLHTVAGRIRGVLGEQDLAARLGGDEFTVLCEGLPPVLGDAAGEAVQTGQRLLAALSQPFDLGGQEQHCSVSIGILVFGETREDPLELLRKADLTLNQAKAAGPGSILFFEPQMLDQVSSRARLQRSLREALHKESFALHYQPQLSEGGAVVGVEALVRWHLQGHGMVSPAEFIPLAEKTGLILPLGRWILRTACMQLAAWARAPARRHLTMAVNVSAGQFQQDDFVQQVREVLAETGAPAGQLKIELTESLMLHQIEDVIARMKALRAVGVRFSLDDFGTGFSSLAYLKRLPLQQLKIDQGFVRDILQDPNDAAIAQTVIALGHSLGLEVIAEGVETAAQRDALAAWGCHLYQGYLFSQPLPGAALETFLAQHPAAAG